MTITIIFLVREKQIACARCNVVSIDKRYGAFAFESDHVDENFEEGRRDKEEVRNEYAEPLQHLKVVEEVTKTQLTCSTCHFTVTHTKDFLHIKKR